MDKVLGNIFAALVIFGIVMYVITESKKAKNASTTTILPK